ncbi:hypothetical protein PLEI_4022 [Photobacterium leiognathi lrivu.4.1]|uniref:Uncharacterized protein n=1 Tax=Photobacterium leiognathi lrivu.4.1 TaxID=1248232 RepID=V5ERC3_PHOLE|nr:hypothetical protein PLEI_4022 [Photobacterium leiognathi lrivu.4.1]
MTFPHSLAYALVAEIAVNNTVAARSFRINIILIIYIESTSAQYQNLHEFNLRLKSPKEAIYYANFFSSLNNINHKEQIY